jgi:uncharacterized protein (TIGR02271 family)
MTLRDTDVQIEPGAAVETSDGRLGIVDEVIVKPETGVLSYLAVRRGWTDERLYVPADLIAAIPNGREVQLRATRDEAVARAGNVPVEARAVAQDSGTQVIVPIVEERLVPDKRAVDLGELRIHKRVETTEEAIRQLVTRDDVEIERVPIDRPLDAPLDTRFEGGTMIIPVMREVLVVQKQLMLAEEIRIRKREVTEEQEVRELVRHERVELEDASAYGVSGLRPGAPSAAPAADVQGRSAADRPKTVPRSS